jgi:hypothetical protein
LTASREEVDAIQAIDGLMFQTQLLSPREHNAMAALFANLAILRGADVLRGSERVFPVGDLLALMDTAIQELEGGEFLRNARLKLPWKTDR